MFCILVRIFFLSLISLSEFAHIGPTNLNLYRAHKYLNRPRVSSACNDTRFQTSVAVLMRSALFWDFTHRGSTSTMRKIGEERRSTCKVAYIKHPHALHFLRYCVDRYEVCTTVWFQVISVRSCITL